MYFNLLLQTTMDILFGHFELRILDIHFVTREYNRGTVIQKR
jgi:hypothetical protein